MPPEHVAADGHAPTRTQPLAALWRTRSYLRPYLGRLIFMLVAACLAVGAEILIPLLTKYIIDGAITHHHRELLVLLGLAATALGAAEAVLNFLRRWAQARAVTGMELAMRDDLYAHLQRLEPGFHDEWQSGQLLSRATTDLSAIRRFAGFGIVFFITNLVTFAIVSRAPHPPELVARPADHLRLPAGGRGVHLVRARLRGAVPAVPGPAGRPGHLRGGGRRGHPGAQGARPPGRGRRAAHRAGARRCTRPR